MANARPAPKPVVVRALGPFDLITSSIMNDAVRVDSISRWAAHVLDLAARRRMPNARRRTSPTLVFFSAHRRCVRESPLSCAISAARYDGEVRRTLLTASFAPQSRDVRPRIVPPVGINNASSPNDGLRRVREGRCEFPPFPGETRSVPVLACTPRTRSRPR